jgi:DNA-binding MarR family transcriptional regulator
LAIVTGWDRQGVTRMDASPFDVVVGLFGAQAAVTRKVEEDLEEGHGLSFSDFMILLRLDAADGGRRRIDLARDLHTSTLAVTRALGPLERIGVVRHEPSPGDPRAAEVLLTDTGRGLLGDARATVEAACRRLFAGGGWDRDDLERFAQFLDRLGGAG